MQIQSEIKNLESSFEAFTDKVGQLKGEYHTLKDQQEQSESLISKLREDEETYSKAVELLSLVQQETRDKVKETFEELVTYALNYIFQSDKYKFELIFGRRGNLQELNFAVKTPDKDEPMDLLDTSGGGVINIVSFALRLILMEICTPKIKGFLILDETFANLSAEYQPMVSELLAELKMRFKRQIIMITHSNEFIDNSNFKKIEIK